MFNITRGSGYKPRICLDKGRQAASEKLKPRVEERKEELSILSSSLQGFIWSFSLALDRTRFIKTWCRVFKLTTPSRTDFFFFFFSHASPLLNIEWQKENTPICCISEVSEFSLFSTKCSYFILSYHIDFFYGTTGCHKNNSNKNKYINNMQHLTNNVIKEPSMFPNVKAVPRANCVPTALCQSV